MCRPIVKVVVHTTDLEIGQIAFSSFFFLLHQRPKYIFSVAGFPNKSYRHITFGDHLFDQG